MVLVLLGAAVGLAATWTHNRWWALALGAAATLVSELAVPPGLLRVAYAGGWVAASAYFLLARPEGDFVVGSDAIGYTFLGLGLVVLVLAVVTIPHRARLPGGPGAST
ncbi:DUF6113 family protein [Nocardioides sp. CER19]|uniref:DUF6113 family protein n=1 Tax=Nocardioides sp. CER19 TaxID=3038538 RepID=UPI002447ECF2|nr:DUF6113 family protein [Nocardioides sp. CER19]MDH2414993.1 DUF6113 family protein [Nocardioides sp. CER19]